MIYFKNAKIFNGKRFVIQDVFFKDSALLFQKSEENILSVYENCIIIPGLTDAHVHLREPGLFYKETIKSGSLAAARGGFTHVFAMPNLNPVPDSVEHLKAETEIIGRDAVIDVRPYGAVTVGEEGEYLADLSGMASNVVAFSDDGKGIQNGELMRSAMLQAKSLNKVLAAHCEVNELLHGGCVHDGEYAKKHNLKGISSESEWRMIERDLQIATETGAKYHVCHVSAKESVALIRKAKANGADVTCETAPHYLLLSDKDLKDDGAYKMNPPLRSEADRQSLLDGIADGTIDMIATDHAPHSLEEKSLGLQGSKMGIVGLETAFPLLYTYLVEKGIISEERLMELTSVKPNERFGIKTDLSSDFTVFQTGKNVRIDPETFLSKGRSTPFAGWTVGLECILTVYNGGTVWKKTTIKN